MQNQNKLSVAIITYNEIKNIEQVIQAVIPIADEIIVVDNGSTDGTIECAKNLGAKVFVEEWKGYGKQKTSAIEKCTCDWILSIDADEVLELKNKTAFWVAIEQSKANVFSIEREDYYFGKKLKYCYRNDFPIRLFKKGHAFFSEDNIHEKMITQEKVVLVQSMQLKHYTVSSIQDYLGKLKNYSTLIAKQHFERGKKTSILTILLKTKFAFFQMYFLRLGFLDGKIGFIVSVLHSYYKFCCYTTLFLMWKERK